MFSNNRRNKRLSVLAAVVLAALALFALRGFLPWGNGGATPSGASYEALIIVDGAPYRRIPLVSGAPRETFTVETGRGKNIITVENGAIAVVDADCPARVCVRQGPISRPGEVIACLPHRLLIEVREAP